MKRKKILVFIDWYLPGYRAGGPIRSCASLISRLSDEFEFFVVTRNTDYMDPVPYASVTADAWNLMPEGYSVFYISEKNLKRSTIGKLIKDTDPDAIYLNGMFSFFFTLVPLWLSRREQGKIIVAARGMLAPGALAIKAFKKKLFLGVAELAGLFDRVIFQATSGEEEKQIRSVFPKAEVRLAPNLSAVTAAHPGKRDKQPGEVRLLNIARIAPEKNLLFAIQTLEKAKGRVVFDIFGPVYDPEYKRKCDRVIPALPAPVQVACRDAVPGHEIPQLMQKYHFLFLPSLGENFGHIILEALASGMPVIISDRTPWRNLEEKRIGWDISLNDPEKFSRVIDAAIGMNQEEFDLYSENARAFAAAYLNDQDKINASRQLFR